jgi:hypothetical protein
MKEEYYRIAINITPNYCETITYTVAIAETFESFLKRQTDEFQKGDVILCIPCTKEEYIFYKRFNPKESYIKFKK